MRLATSLRGVSLILGIMASVTLVGSVWAQPGSVQTHVKINSDVLAQAGVLLDDHDEFGDAVANLGDLDGPGPSVVALAVGAVGDDDGGSDKGAVYVLFLDARSEILSYRKISSTQGNFTGLLDVDDQFGGAIAGLGDLDGPGPSVTAIAVGAVADDDGGMDSGAVYILFLDSTGRVLSHQKISRMHGNFTGNLDPLDEFGGAVAGLGDVDGPGPSRGALAVGVIGDDDGGVNRGATYILFLGSTGTVLSHQKISNTQGNFTALFDDNDNFGEDVASLGDLDGPGPSVIAVASSAVDDDDGGHDRGAVYVMFLNMSGSVLSHRKISDTQGNFAGPLQDDDNFGSSVAGLRDLDGSGSGVAALVVGAANDSGAGVERGAMYVLLLDETGNVVSYQETSSTAGGFEDELEDEDTFGSATCALGDIDENGPAVETVVSAVSTSDDGRGGVYVCYLAGSSSTVAVDESHAPSPTNGLSHVRPNPFKNATTVPFRINEAARVRIDILDVRGRIVREFVEQAAAGEHHVIWDGLDNSGHSLPQGAYYMKMSVNGQPLATGTKAVRLR